MFVDGGWYLIESPDENKYIGCQALADGSNWAMQVVAQDGNTKVVLYNEDSSIAEVLQTEKPQSWWDEISANILAYNGQEIYFENSMDELGPSPTVISF